MVGVVGVTAMEASVALLTCSVVLPEMAPEVALMTLSPTETGVARPAVLWWRPRASPTPR